MEKISFLAHSRLVNISIGFLMASVWGVFAMRNIQAFMTTGAYVFLVFCFSETLQAAFFLFRSTPKNVSLAPFAWLIAIGGTFAPLLYRPGGMMIFAGGQNLVVLGVVIQVTALLSLNRSFGIIAARREVKTSGLYQLVRHPMYASYLFSYVGYVLYNATAANLACAMFALIFLFFRIEEEENLLIADPEYQAYKQSVRWRLLPFVY